jgi:ectoine hydroxylase-related dioxygenase (phytanoyl-CoA dioxygenase family)
MSQLDASQLQHFNEYGYLVLKDTIEPKEILDPIMAEYESVLNLLATKLKAEGKIDSLHATLPFGDRVTRIYQESNAVHNQYFDFSLPQKGITKETPFWAGPAVFDALTNPNLLDVVESVIGPEVYSNPVQHVRVKVPEDKAPRDSDGNVIYGATPWHQDLGVVTEEADTTDLLTVWFPLMDTDVENGCLQVIPGSHRNEVLTHCPGAQGIQIPESLLDSDKARAIPLKRGSVLLLHRKTIHNALPNRSNRIRWSFDLRYQPIGQPTGRETFPGFIARSAQKPSEELHDSRAWFQMWETARDSLARDQDPSYNRWDANHALCA